MSRYIAQLSKSAFAFYFFDFSNDVKTKTSSCLRSIILQLAEQKADTTSLEALQRTYAMGTPPSQELLDVLKSMSCKLDRLYIVVDALDECTDQDELFDLITAIRDWKLECLSILVTSRDEPGIRECLEPTAEQEILLKNSAIDDDIRLFIVETLKKDRKLQVWSELFPEIEKALGNRARGMFRWVDCQIQALRGCPSRTEVRRALQDLPETLDKTYERTLRNIRPSHRSYALRLLQWLCIANEPVALQHVIESFGVIIGETPRFDPDAQFVSFEKILALCPGLVVRIRKKTRSYLVKKGEKEFIDCVQIAHYSVKEYLISDRLPTAPDPLCIFKVQKRLAYLTMAKICLVYAISGPNELTKLESSFAHSARQKWPTFFKDAEHDSQLMELAILHLTRTNGHSLRGDINAAMDLIIEYGLHDLETMVFDRFKPRIDPDRALLAKCSRHDLGSPEFVEFWIEQGANVNARFLKGRVPLRPRRGSTPLHLAAYSGNVALAQALLRNGAHLVARDVDGRTPLVAAFKYPCSLTLELVELLWFEGAHYELNLEKQNLLHLAAGLVCQKYGGNVWSRIDGSLYDRSHQSVGLTHNRLAMEETVAWLIDHAVNPHGKDLHGDTPLHKAASSNNVIALQTLIAATKSSSEYGGCLLAFLERLRDGGRQLSTAQSLFEVDPKPFGGFQHGNGLLPWVLRQVTWVHRGGSAFDSKFLALFPKQEEDPTFEPLSFYVSCLRALLQNAPNECFEVLNWLAHLLVKRRHLDFLGTEIWTAAIICLSRDFCAEMEREAGEGISHRYFRQVRELFGKRRVFGVDIKQLHRLLHYQDTLVRGPLQRPFARPFARMIALREAAYAEMGLPNEVQRVLGSLIMAAEDEIFVILMAHSEIHPDTKDEDGEAALLNAMLHGKHAMTRLLIGRLLLKSACDLNHLNKKGLTPLAYGVSYLSPQHFRSNEVLGSFLDAGCDANIQDVAGRTPLMIAAYRGVIEFIELLLHANCCDMDLQDRGGGPPETKIIFKEDESVNRKECWKQRYVPMGGYTALMYTVILGDIDAVKLFLENGCDTKLKNNQGRTALDLAKQFDEHGIVEVLLGHEQHEQGTFPESGD